MQGLEPQGQPDLWGLGTKVSQPPKPWTAGPLSYFTGASLARAGRAPRCLCGCPGRGSWKMPPIPPTPALCTPLRDVVLSFHLQE